MKVIAHRGYSGKYPENTMLAFKMALEAGCDEIELDIQMSADGRIVIFHDESTGRVTGVPGLVRNFTFEELRKLDASALYAGKFGFNPVPSLEEYFSWVKDTGISTNIELKNSVFYYEALEAKTTELIKKYGLEKRVMFSSFNHASLVKCKELAPSIPCGVLVSAPGLGNAPCFLKSFGFEYYHPDIGCLNDETVAECKKQGIGLNVWTVNDMGGLLRLEEWGCDGIITNFPDVCKKWLKNNPSLRVSP
ncbi:MAG: glycerophosphodiester phosphodiesterase [Treponema sp.]|jgi:glycerophosphoryl diester phosphodiesterase|nr:glycerophosphodiester phosphodiesterase [Treponema sp.]